jgi:hypothetical protein
VDIVAGDALGPTEPSAMPSPSTLPTDSAAAPSEGALASTGASPSMLAVVVSILGMLAGALFVEAARRRSRSRQPQ